MNAYRICFTTPKGDRLVKDVQSATAADAAKHVPADCLFNYAYKH